MRWNGRNFLDFNGGAVVHARHGATAIQNGALIRKPSAASVDQTLKLVVARRAMQNFGQVQRGVDGVGII